ncbi:hypothetical protein BSZ39_13085, partial [Bowdeniella nasicola]
NLHLRRASTPSTSRHAANPNNATYTLDCEEPLTSQVLDEFAMALVNVCALLDPEVIVLAGRFSALADFLIPELSRRLEGRVLHVPHLIGESTPIPGALLGASLVAEAEFGPLEQLL